MSHQGKTPEFHTSLGRYVPVHHIAHPGSQGSPRYYSSGLSSLVLPSYTLIAYTAGYATIVRKLQATKSKLCPPNASLVLTKYPVCQEFNPFSTESHVEVVSGFTDGSLFLFNPLSLSVENATTTTQTQVKGLAFPSPFPKSAVTCIRWLPSSKRVFLVSYANGIICIFDTSSSSSATLTPRPGLPGITSSNSIDPLDPILHWRVSSSAISDMAFNSDGSQLAVSLRTGLVIVFELLTAKILSQFSMQFGGVSCVSWSPDDRYIATGSEDDRVTIWNTETLECTGEARHESWVSRVEFHPVVRNQEYVLVSTGQDGKLGVWKYSSGLKLETLVQAHDEPVRGLVVSFDVVSTICSHDRLKIWALHAPEEEDHIEKEAVIQ